MVHTERLADFHSRNPLTTALDAIPLAILLIDTTLKIRWVNRRGETLFGCEAKLLVGQSIEPNQDGRWTWGKRFDLRERIQTLFRGGDSIRGEEQRLTLLLDGKKIEQHLRINTSPIEFAGKQMALMVLENITLLKELEKKNKETERLSLTIQMARASVHDLNQPLSVLVGNLDLLEQHLDVNGSFRKHIERILRSADRVTEVIRRLQMIIHSTKKREILKAGVADSSVPPASFR